MPDSTVQIGQRIERAILQLQSSLIQVAACNGMDVDSYRTDIDSGTIYSGYILNGVHTITRCVDGTVEYASGVTDLDTDWPNRLGLTYA